MMQHPRSISHTIRNVILWLLSCLGLSGIADNFVVWKDWYDVGVMVHWRSFKDLVYDVFLFWIPLSIPNWTLDYILLGAVCARAYWAAQSSDFREVASLRTTKDYYILSNLSRGESKLKICIKINSLYILTFILFSFLIIPFWPLVLLLTAISAFKGRTENANIPIEDGVVKEYLQKMQKAGTPNDFSTLKLFAVMCLLFIPLLFVATNELPKVISLF